MYDSTTCITTQTPLNYLQYYLPSTQPPAALPTLHSTTCSTTCTPLNRLSPVVLNILNYWMFNSTYSLLYQSFNFINYKACTSLGQVYRPAEAGLDRIVQELVLEYACFGPVLVLEWFRTCLGLVLGCSCVDWSWDVPRVITDQYHNGPAQVLIDHGLVLELPHTSPELILGNYFLHIQLHVSLTMHASNIF